MKITSVFTRLLDKLGLGLAIVYEYLASFFRASTNRETYSIQTLGGKMTRVCNFRYRNRSTHLHETPPHECAAYLFSALEKYVNTSTFEYYYSCAFPPLLLSITPVELTHASTHLIYSLLCQPQTHGHKRKTWHVRAHISRRSTTQASGHQ